MKYFVYILLCKGDRLYTGISKDVEKRFKIHKTGKGAKFTRVFKPIKIVYKEQFNSYKEASQREYQIKGWRQEKKLILINSYKK